MDWLALIESMSPPDHDLPARTIRLQRLQRVLYNTQYDHLQHAFDQETRGTGDE